MASCQAPCSLPSVLPLSSQSSPKGPQSTSRFGVLFFPFCTQKTEARKGAVDLPGARSTCGLTGDFNLALTPWHPCQALWGLVHASHLQEAGLAQRRGVSVVPQERPAPWKQTVLSLPRARSWESLLGQPCFSTHFHACWPSSAHVYAVSASAVRKVLYRKA